MKRYKIVINNDGHITTVNVENEVTIFKNSDMGQVVDFFREAGLRHVRENHIDYFVCGDDWQKIDEVVDRE